MDSRELNGGVACEKGVIEVGLNKPRQQTPRDEEQPYVDQMLVDVGKEV